MGVFSELDLENQQEKTDKYSFPSAQAQTLQAHLIQQHEQKKAAAAAEKPNTEPAAERAPVNGSPSRKMPAAAEAEKRRLHEEAEAKTESGMGAAAAGKTRR